MRPQIKGCGGQYGCIGKLTSAQLPPEQRERNILYPEDQVWRLGTGTENRAPKIGSSAPQTQNSTLNTANSTFNTGEREEEQKRIKEKLSGRGLDQLNQRNAKETADSSSSSSGGTTEGKGEGSA